MPIHRQNDHALAQAKEALLAEARIVLEVLTTPQNEDGQGINTTVVLQKNKTRQKFYALVTTTLNQARATQIAARRTEGDTPTLIITRYVPYNLGKKLREMNVQYIDAAGNAFINTPTLQFFINGNKRKERTLEHAEKGFLTKGGVRVVFALLCKPDLTKAPYRQIADTAGVAVGTVDTVMKRLQYHRFVENLGPKGRRLVQREELLDRWVIGYTEQLRPKQLIGLYRTVTDIRWKDEVQPEAGAWWGGEIAAAKLTNYLKPFIVTIYTAAKAKELILRYKLTKDQNGTVELREVFWNFLIEPGATVTVPPLLVYADLVATADPRNIETAKIIYDEHLARHLKDN